MLSYGALYGSIESDFGPGALLGGVGVLVGPSLGHVYTGDTTRTVLPIIGRTVGLVTMLVGGWRNDDQHANTTLTVGRVLFFGSTAYSVIDSYRSAARRNARKQRRFTITPGPVVGPTQSTGIGLMLGGAF